MKKAGKWMVVLAALVAWVWFVIWIMSPVTAEMAGRMVGERMSPVIDGMLVGRGVK